MLLQANSTSSYGAVADPQVWQEIMSEIVAGQASYSSPSELVDAYVQRMLAVYERAEWTTAYVNDLPDSAFLYIAPGGSKDGEGKTTPRSLRYFPVRDASGKIDLPHLRNAIARAPQANLPESVQKRVQARARKLLEKEDSTKSDDLDSLFGELIEFGMKSLDTRKGEYLWIGSSHNAWKDRSQDIIPLRLILEDIHHQTQMIQEGKASQYGYGLWQDHRSSKIIGTCDLRAVVDGGRSCLEMGVLSPGSEELPPAPMSIGYKALVGKDDEYKAVFVYERSRLQDTVPVNARTFWRARKRMKDTDIARAAQKLAEAVRNEDQP